MNLLVPKGAAEPRPFRDEYVRIPHPLPTHQDTRQYSPIVFTANYLVRINYQESVLRQMHNLNANIVYFGPKTARILKSTFYSK